MFLSDGAANDAPTFLASTSPYRTNPCGQGVTSAGIAKAAKVLVYSIAYTANGDECDAAIGAKIGGTTVQWYGSSNWGTPETPALAAETALAGDRNPRRQLLLRPAEPDLADRHLPADRRGHRGRHRPDRPVARPARVAAAAATRAGYVSGR